MTSEYSLPASSAQAAGNKVFSVSALNMSVARLMESQIPLCWVAGEISNFTRAASGHWYFTLKDEGAQVRSVMFRGRSQYAQFQPRDGDKVEVRAQVTLYAPRGDYQLNVEAIRRAGVGNLYEAFLRLKEALAAQGLFAEESKQPLPFFPRTIGIITSPQAAALRDVITAFARRSPHVQLILYPVPVQGQGAAEKIAQMIKLADARQECDLLILCRGGGSIEDLWCFNEEIVAHAIAACQLPLISGVGHETDFTIADFVADVRAPTPTAAAELAARPTEEWQAALKHWAKQMQRAQQRQIQQAAQQLDFQSRRLLSPAALLKRERLRLQALQTRMQHATSNTQRNASHHLKQLQTRLQPPDTRLPRAQLTALTQRQTQAITQHQAKARNNLAALQDQLNLLNPQRTLERGYAIITNEKGTILRSAEQVVQQSQLQLRLAQGVAQVEVAAAKVVE